MILLQPFLIQLLGLLVMSTSAELKMPYEALSMAFAILKMVSRLDRPWLIWTDSSTSPSPGRPRTSRK